MYKLNFIAVVSIVAAVSLAVGMASPVAAVAFAAQHENMAMNRGNNMSSMGNMTGGSGNATSMAETEILPTASQTGR